MSPDWYALLARILGTQLCSQLSPVATEQSWVSLHRFGVMKLNVGSVLLLRSSRKAPDVGLPIGTSSAMHAVRSSPPV